MTELARTVVILHVGMTVTVALALAAVGIAAEVREHPLRRPPWVWPSDRRSPWCTTEIGSPWSPQRPASPPATSRVAPCPNRRTTVPIPIVRLDDAARALLRHAARDGQLQVVVGMPPLGDPARYRDAELRHRDLDPGLATRPVVFLEVDPMTPANPAHCLYVRGLDLDGYPVLRVGAAAVAPALAAVAMHMRTTIGARPHLRFAPSPGGRFTDLPRYVLLECTASRTRSLIHAADGDFTGRPVVHLNG
jgi:hypothetical protein